MHKLQCLNTAKAYLNNTLYTSIRFLADHNQWRNQFKDELQTNFKEWVLKKLEDEFSVDDKSSHF